MLDVLVYFGIALVASLLGAVQQSVSSRFLKVIFFCLIICWLAFFAGVRDLSVGTDTLVYGVPAAQVAAASSFIDFYNGYYSNWAPLIKIFYWVVSNATHSSFWVLFWIQIAIGAPALYVISRDGEKFAPLGIFVYVIMFYPMGFNMMRQMIAMGFMLISFHYASERKPLLFIVWLLIGCGFHASLLVTFIIYPITCFIQDVHLSTGLRISIVVVLSIIFCLFFSLGTDIFSSIGFYSNYFTDSRLNEGGSLRPFAISALLIVTLISIASLLGAKYTDRNKSALPLLSIILLGLALLLLTSLSRYLYRVGIMFIYFLPVLIIQLSQSIAKHNKRYFLLFAIITVVLTIWWSFDFYLVQGNHQVIPYLLAGADFRF